MFYFTFKFIVFNSIFKMSKKVKKLEKEGAAWKSKWEKSNKALIEMAEDVSIYITYLKIFPARNRNN